MLEDSYMVDPTRFFFRDPRVDGPKIVCLKAFLGYGNSLIKEKFPTMFSAWGLGIVQLNSSLLRLTNADVWKNEYNEIFVWFPYGFSIRSTL